MKTKFLLLSTVLFLSFSICNAQHRVSAMSESEVAAATSSTKTKASRGGFLISAGANIANLSGSDADNNVGASISLGYSSSVDGGFIYTYAANYTRGGYKLDFDGIDIKANLDYVGWYMNFLFKTAGNLYLGFGYGLNYLVSAKYSYDGETSDIEDTNFFNISVPISARYYIGENKSVFLDASYNIGLLPVFGDGFLGDGCNRGFILSLGFKL